MGCHALLQGIFPTQGWNPGLLCILHWQVVSLLLAPPGKLQNTDINFIFFKKETEEFAHSRGSPLGTIGDPGASSTTSHPPAHAPHSLNWPLPLWMALLLGVGPEGCILGPGKPGSHPRRTQRLPLVGEGPQAPNQLAAKHTALNWLLDTRWNGDYSDS